MGSACPYPVEPIVSGTIATGVYETPPERDRHLSRALIHTGAAFTGRQSRQILRALQMNAFEDLTQNYH